MAYWDSSCLLKLYVTEYDSADFESYLLTNPDITTSAIARFELWAAFRRKEALGDISAGGEVEQVGMDWGLVKVEKQQYW